MIYGFLYPLLDLNMADILNRLSIFNKQEGKEPPNGQSLTLLFLTTELMFYLEKFCHKRLMTRPKLIPY